MPDENFEGWTPVKFIRDSREWLALKEECERILAEEELSINEKMQIIYILKLMNDPNITPEEQKILDSSFFLRDEQIVEFKDDLFMFNARFK